MRDPVMVGERVYLRPFEPEDGRTFAQASAREQGTMMDRGRVPTSPIAFERWYSQGNTTEIPSLVDFFVCAREDDRLIGAVALIGIDWIHRTADTASMLLGEEVRGRGFGTEAKLLLLEYAFDRLQLHALRSYVWEPNARSAAALVKQGYQLAGRVRWNDLKDGVFRDSLVFDVLREDWVRCRA